MQQMGRWQPPRPDFFIAIPVDHGPPEKPLATVSAQPPPTIATHRFTATFLHNFFPVDKLLQREYTMLNVLVPARERKTTKHKK
jgi:hypothetical protein